MDYKSIIIIALILFEIGMCSYLIYKDLKGTPNVCMIGHSCDSVQSSIYGSIFGIKLSYIAVFAFISLLLSFLFYKPIFAIGTYLGAAAAVVLIAIQLFVLKEICSNCMIIDGTMILILLASLFL